MAQIAIENFDSQPNGTVLTDANTIFTNHSGAGSTTFSSEWKISGTCSMKVVTAANSIFNRYDLPAAKTLVWVSFYLHVVGNIDSNTAFMVWYAPDHTSKIGDLRMLPGTSGPQLQLRDNNTGQYSSTELAPGDYRIAVKVQPGSATGHQLKIYGGANLNSTTTSQDSSGQPATANAQTQVGDFRFGSISSSTVTYHIDRLIFDDAAEPAALVTNQPPTVNAGADQSNVSGGATVTLAATASDPDGTTPTVTWAQTGGTPTVTLSGTGYNRTFTAPIVASATALTFTATASDGTLTGTDSVVINVLANRAPTVNAGVDQTGISPGTTVTLTATASDPEGTTPTISWAQTAGTPTVTLSGSGATRTFTAPSVVGGTTLTFTATAGDGALTSTDTMTVSVNGSNQAPLVNAGADQVNIEPFGTVTLTATASDPDGTTPTVSWSQISGTAVTLSGSGSTRTFVAPATHTGDTLVFRATASDGTLQTTDDVAITVYPQNRWKRNAAGTAWIAIQPRLHRSTSNTWV